MPTLQQRFEAAGQGHVFKFWPTLSQSEQNSLASQLESIDIERVNRIYKTAVSAEHSNSASEPIEPLPKTASDSVGINDAHWNDVGLAAIARGHVGVLLMAGGQGTRLGSTAPKGCYDIGLPSHKSLFQYQAERIARLQTLAEKGHAKPPGSVVIPWYVMTSGPTRSDTEAFFVKHKFFGLDAKNVIFFEQGIFTSVQIN